MSASSTLNIVLSFSCGSVKLQQAIYMLQLQARTPPNQQSMASNVPLASFIVGPGLDIFQALITDMDSEGRYLFLNAIVNQLRYPNTQTHYFSFMLLYLFAESSQVKLFCFFYMQLHICKKNIFLIY